VNRARGLIVGAQFDASTTPRSVRRRGYVCAAVIVTATVLDWFYHAGRWTWHDPDGYNFISGPLADVTLIGGAYVIVRRHNCHAKGCWRIGRHKVPGTDYVVCRHHHPDETPTAQQILDAHHAALKRRSEVVHAAETVVHGADRVIKDVEEVVHRDDEPPPEKGSPPPDPSPAPG